MSRSRGSGLRAFAVLAIVMYGLYLALAGSTSPTDLLFGAVASVIAAWLVKDLLVSEARKLSVVRAAYLVKYLVKYFLVDEVRAHLDVARRALSPSMPLNPGFVEVPYDLRSEYAVLMVANSVTNTPGTVTVAVDEEGRRMYIHWIDVKAVEPEACRNAITKWFEENARKVFD